MASYLLGVDLGTSGVKAGLYDPELQRLAVARSGRSSVQVPRPGFSEADPDVWWADIVAAVRNVQATAGVAPKDIGALGVSSFFPAVVPLASDGTPIRPAIMYNDQRSVPQVDRLVRRFGRDAIETAIGNTLAPGTSAVTSIRWLYDNEPKTVAACSVFGFANSFVTSRLTGRAVTDTSNSALSGLVDIRDPWHWSAKLCADFRVDQEKLPPVLEAPSIVGTLTDSAASALGLSAHVQVAVGCGDTQASTVGAGVVGEPTVVYIAGSTDCVTIPMQSPTTDLRWINAGHVVPDRWLGIGSTSAAGASVDWFVRHFLPGADGHERMVRLAKGASTDVPPVLYLPYLAGERTPLWDPQATGVFFGLTASAGLEHLARGVFEGTAFALRDVITCLEEITPEGVGDIVAAGGGARNGFWNQVKANALQKPLRVCDTGESGCKAAALLAGVGSGVFPSVEQAAESVRATLTYHAVEPDECFADYYDGLFDAYQSLYRNTRELMHRIPQLRNPIRDGGDG